MTSVITLATPCLFTYVVESPIEGGGEGRRERGGERGGGEEGRRERGGGGEGRRERGRKRRREGEQK